MKTNLNLYLQDTHGAYRRARPEEILQAANRHVSLRFRRGAKLESSEASKSYLKCLLAELEHEVFCVLWLDNRHRVLTLEEMFRGTIDGATVHPREVVKRALAHNAAACILVHNHPSGIAEPSQADQRLTKRLTDALGLVDVRVLDHIVVGDDVISMNERGLIS